MINDDLSKESQNEDLKNNAEQNLSDSEKISQEETEIFEIIQNSEHVKGQRLLLDEFGEFKTEDELKKFAFGDVDDPEKKYDVYYHGIEKLLKLYPKPLDKVGKKAFKLVREEKNIFLNRGKKLKKGIRKGDARMAYLSDMETAANIIQHNYLNGGNLFELFMSFRDQNIKLGYFKTASDEQN
jgi:hypothetical protein